MIKYENSCNGCPDCIGCGRDRKYPVWYCDRCGESFYEEGYLTEIAGGEELCDKCLEEESEEDDGR